MLKTNKVYSGSTIMNFAAENGGKLSVDGTWVRVPMEKIKPNNCYSFIKTEKGMTIQHHTSSWTCDSATMNYIQKRGNDIVNNMFGDIFAMTKNIK